MVAAAGVGLHPLIDGDSQACEVMQRRAKTEEAVVWCGLCRGEGRGRWAVTKPAPGAEPQQPWEGSAIALAPAESRPPLGAAAPFASRTSGTGMLVDASPTSNTHRSVTGLVVRRSVSCSLVAAL